MRVLLAYDGGPVGESAMRVIAPWVQQSGAAMHIVHVLKADEIHDTARPLALHVLTPGGSPTGTPLYAQEPPAVLAEDRSQALDAVCSAAEEEMLALGARHLGRYPVVVHVVVGEEAPAEILAAAKAADAQLIVVGSHGRKGISHVFLGSVAEAVVRHATIPVLVVGPKVG